MLILPEASLRGNCCVKQVQSRHKLNYLSHFKVYDQRLGHVCCGLPCYLHCQPRSFHDHERRVPRVHGAWRYPTVAAIFSQTANQVRNNPFQSLWLDDGQVLQGNVSVIVAAIFVLIVNIFPGITTWRSSTKRQSTKGMFGILFSINFF